MAIAAAVLLAASQARSQPAEEPAPPCEDTYEHAQHLRISGDLLHAREELHRCAASSCPTLIQSDCTTWLGQVSEVIPSVVFSAKVGDEDVFDVTVTVDGIPVVSHLDGQRLEINPGMHAFPSNAG